MADPFLLDDLGEDDTNIQPFQVEEHSIAKEEDKAPEEPLSPILRSESVFELNDFKPAPNPIHEQRKLSAAANFDNSDDLLEGLGETENHFDAQFESPHLEESKRLEFAQQLERMLDAEDTIMFNATRMSI